MNINRETILETEIPVVKVTDLFMHWGVNTHAILEIKGILEYADVTFVMEKDYCKSEIKLISDAVVYNNEEKDRILFHGLVQSVEVAERHGVGIVCIQAVSATTALDYTDEKICRAFPPDKRTCVEMARAVVSQKGGNLISTLEINETEGCILCYQETAWQFAKRLVSYHGGVLVPDVKTGHINLWFGMRNGRQIWEDMVLPVKEIRIKKDYCKREPGQVDKTYLVESMLGCSVGDWTMFLGQKLVIYDMTVRLEKGELLFLYKLSPEKKIRLARINNEAFSGLCLSGRVEKTSGEVVYVLFDMDQAQCVCAYPWMPDTGNTFYSMPEVGAWVEIYFTDSDERNGIAVHSMTTVMGKTTDKIFMTPHEGTVKLSENHLEIRKNNEKICFQDGYGIRFTGNRFEIGSEGSVKLRAGNIVLHAVTELKAVTE